MEGKIVWLQVEVELGEQEGKVEVRAWRHGPTVPETVAFYLGEGEEDTMKGGVNGFGRKHRNKCSKSMKMEGSENMPREFSQVYVEMDV